jgi:hypothetical protein
MTIQQIPCSLEDSALNTEDPEMTIELRAQSVFLMERTPRTLFGGNPQPTRVVLAGV